MNCRSSIGRLSFKALLVFGILAAWAPTAALGYLWLRWFLFFVSIKDYGENDFGTLFYVVIGLVLTGGILVSGILSTAISTGILRSLKSAKPQQIEPTGS